MARSGARSEALTVENNARTIEKLLALYRYEMEPGRGCGPGQALEDLLEFVEEFTVNDPRVDIDNLKPREQAAWFDRIGKFNEAILRAFVALGDGAKAFEFVEGVAACRAECEAKFDLEREIAFTAEEREGLAEGWDATAAANKAA